VFDLSIYYEFDMLEDKNPPITSRQNSIGKIFGMDIVIRALTRLHRRRVWLVELASKGW
jgi:hypothetical protein